MQTNFTLAQLADPDTAEAEKILRSCVHCGFCLATCPTYTLLGDELDSPRGRIYLMKDMLENDKPATEKVVRHIDRCLSCLSCMTTCPSGVHYQHLVDHGRAHIEKTYKRPFVDRMIRRVLSGVLPYPTRFRLALMGAKLARPFARPLARVLPAQMVAMLDLVPKSISPPSPWDQPQVFRAEGERRGRVAMLIGCAQQVLEPEINEATIRLLNRMGLDVVVPDQGGCCGALVHHMGRVDSSHDQARANMAGWLKEMDGEGLDAIVINASGCGTQVKDYGYMFRTDPDWAESAARVSALARDVTEVIQQFGAPPRVIDPGLRVTYHSACSMQHGQKLTGVPKTVLRAVGVDAADVPEGHLCCGSAGTYNIMQPEIATQLRDRKVANIDKTRPDIVVTGNIGCMTQIGSATPVPILHTVQYVDWVTGGPRPSALEDRDLPATVVAADTADGARQAAE